MDKITLEKYSKEKGLGINILVPMKAPSNRPNREGIALLWASQNKFMRYYPRKCDTDKLKLIHLGDWFIRNEISEEMFIEFSEVLTLMAKKDKIVEEIYEKKLEGELKW